MCGIAGYVNTEHLAQTHVKAIEDISKKLVRRGPDSCGMWKDDNVILAHRRLAIIDLSSTGHQPIHSRSGRWTLVLNGEIINYVELREELGGPWKGTGDAETLVEALDRWGLDTLTKLAGMFAFAAWDHVDQRLILARDPIGIKPLFYNLESEKSLFFSSTASSLASLQNPKLNDEALSCVLALGFPASGETLFKGIHELPPAHFAIWKNRSMGKPHFQTQRYWNLSNSQYFHPSSTDQTDEEFKSLFEKILKQWTRSDVPTSLLLSSGVDSTAIALGLTITGQSVTTLTAKMKHPQLDESITAQKMARQLSLPNKTIDIETIDPLDVLDQIAFHSDLPVIDSSQVGTWLLFQKAADFGKVVFTGDGADEIFAGYPTHLANGLLTGISGVLLKSVSNVISPHLSGVPYGEGPPGLRHKIVRLLRYAKYGLPQAAFRWRTLIDPSLFSELISSPLKNPWMRFLPSEKGYSYLSAPDRALAMEVEHLLPQGEVARLDRMSMAHGLEARPPFLDHRMVEFAFRFPFNKKINFFSGGKLPICRWIKKNLQGWSRPPKKGFNHPVQEWFQGALGDRLLEEMGINDAFPVNPQKVNELLNLHRKKKFDLSFELWTILFILTWTRVHKISR